MFDQLVGLLLLGLGLRTPPLNLNVQGEATQASNLKQDLERKRTEAQEKFKTQRAEFTQKLQALKDARKKEILTKLADRFCEVNKKRTDQMAEHLTKMSGVLDKVAARAATVKDKGADVGKVESSVTTARTAITAAQTAVTTQAGRDCTITLTTEENVGQNTRAAIKTLESDLKSVHAQVAAARQAVSQTLAALEAVLVGAVANTASPAGTVKQ